MDRGERAFTKEEARLLELLAGVDTTTGCAIALDLLDAFGDVDSLARGGLAHGTVVARHGDYYGPVANLAARLADVAVSGEVLADAALATTAASDRFASEPAGRRPPAAEGLPRAERGRVRAA